MSSTARPTPVVVEPIRASTVTASLPAGTPQRVASIDLLRGVVMVLMALDHVRDFFSNAFFNPLDLVQATPALFLTRWITHLCAPVFVLLAGVGGYLYGTQGRTKADVARFLFTRGLLLVALEFTLVHFGWFFTFDYHFMLAQVIWMLGWCMVLLAGLIFLPTWTLVALAVLMIGGHNVLDGIVADDLEHLRWLWIVLHQRGTIELASNRQLFVLYPLVPWIGVMAAGYAIGPVLLRPPRERRRWLFGLGLGLTLAFALLRWVDLYGDPQPWAPQADIGLAILSFLKVEKYPPSLLFLLMTLGPALLLLGAFDRLSSSGWLARSFVTFGQVPLFYYALHLILVHTIAVILSFSRYGDASWLLGTGWMLRVGLPQGYGYDLPVVYLVWLGVVVLLFPACRWFAALKWSRRARWMAYV